MTAYIMKQFGPHAVVDLARKMGVKSKILAVPSLCLGTFDLSVYEMVGAYSTFANKGVWTEPIFINKITDKNGVVLENFSPKTQEAMSQNTADIMIRLLQGVVDGVYSAEAKVRRAKISYYQGDFNWAQAQVDVLKKSTSKLIANNAMELSLLIQDNLNLDTTTVTMEIFSRADLLIYQNKLNEAYATLDSIIIDYQGHSLVDEALFRQYDIKIKQDKKEDASELLDQVINFFSFNRK